MPLWAIIELSRLANINLHKVERNILAYRSGICGGLISNPKLPILANPELDSIVIHLIADGYVNDKIMTPSYCQKKENDRSLFIKKLHNVFGDFNGSLSEGKVFRFPKAITKIISNYYNIKSFMSKTAIVPEKISNNTKTSKLACIIAFILDEGNIRDVICVFSVNKRLISQIRLLFMGCGYRCNPLRYGSKRYWFSMKNSSIKRFHKDYKKLQNIYPTCSLGTKYIKLYTLSSKVRK
ncbi:MAG: hypothetical protein HYS32_00130 [Candidatus Woesearchaeota archaeon]|nr:MAG: hypothetical protein HYS32_00130 [Candidatus Woesearchaeota archaeon]